MARLVVLAIAAIALCAAPARAAGPWFGFNDDSVLRHQLTPRADAALLRGAGANAVRVTVDWTWVQRRGGPVDLRLYDPLYAALRARGIRPLFVVMGAPRWAWPPWVLCFRGQPCHFAPDRTRDADWGRFVAAVARRFPDAAGIEVWNEPNLAAFFAPAPDPERYVELLRIAYRAVKGVAPGMPVIGGALAGDTGDETTAAQWGMRPFLQAMLAAGARASMDGLSLHPYPHGRFEAGTWEAVDVALRARQGLPLWLTEVGASTTAGVTRAQQALLLGDLVPRLARRPAVAAVFVHTLVAPRGLPPGDPEAGYGIAGKPAYCALALAMLGRAPCLAALPAAPPLWDAQEALEAAVEAAIDAGRSGQVCAGRLCAQLDPDGAVRW